MAQVASPECTKTDMTGGLQSAQTRPQSPSLYFKAFPATLPLILSYFQHFSSSQKQTDSTIA